MGAMPRKRPKAETIGPTPERLARGEFVQRPAEYGGKAGVMVMQARDNEPLEWYHARQMLCPTDRSENDRLYDAGARVREAWHRSGLQASVSGGYQSAVQTSRDPDMRMCAALTASRAYQRLIRYAGICWPPVFYVCCLAESVGTKRMDRLRLGLQNVADGEGL